MRGRFITLAAVVLLTTFAATGDAAGFDAPALAKLEHRIRSGEIPGIHAVIAVQRGKTIAEWYFEGADETIGDALGHVKFGPETLHDIRSVTKSVMSLLFGIAVGEGAIKDLDAPVLDYFPEYADLRTPERMKITLRHVLSMTSGLHWDEATYPYSDPRNSEIAMDMAQDPYRHTLSQAIDAPAGARWNYSGGDVALVGAIITRAVKLPLEPYAQSRLFEPLGITFEWSKNNGVPRAASGLRLKPRDMAKLGQLVLDGGRWDGRQIVAEDWIRNSTARHAQIQPDPACGTAYGYLWWIDPGCSTTPPAPSFGGVGNGGQRIWIVPSRDLVVVTTAGMYNDPKAFGVTTGIIAETAASVAASAAAN